MDNIVTISNIKENVLEFNADIEGLDKSNMAVKFIINANGMNIGFDANHKEGSKWEVTIPPLPMLERTAYPFKMDVTSDGYYFEPIQGTVNVVGSHDVYVSSPTNQKVAPADASKDADNVVFSTPVSESTITAKPVSTRKGNSTADIVKRILTKVQSTENVSTAITETKTIQVKKPAINKAIPASNKLIVAENKKTKVNTSTPVNTKTDKAVLDILAEDDSVDTKKSSTINKIKKIN